MSAPLSKKRYSFNQLSYNTIGACIDVQSQLGVHCTEVDYQRALELALPKHDVQFQREVEIPITFDEVVVTRRRVDFVVWNDTDELILETKARSTILPEDVEQCLLYLHQGGYRLCLLVNFGEKPLDIRRFVHTPTDKKRENQASLNHEGRLDHEAHERTRKTRKEDAPLSWLSRSKHPVVVEEV